MLETQNSATEQLKRRSSWYSVFSGIQVSSESSGAIHSPAAAAIARFRAAPGPRFTCRISVRGTGNDCESDSGGSDPSSTTITSSGRTVWSAIEDNARSRRRGRSLHGMIADTLGRIQHSAAGRGAGPGSMQEQMPKSAPRYVRRPRSVKDASGPVTTFPLWMDVDM